MRASIFLSLVPVAGLSGCNKIDSWRHPEAAACRKYILAGLRSPSTYSEVSRAYGKRTGVDERKFQSVSLSYDAANAYGTPVRATETCEFEINAKGDYLRDPNTAAVLASADRALGKEEGESCCLPAFALKPDDPLANMTADDLPLISNGVVH